MRYWIAYSLIVFDIQNMAHPQKDSVGEIKNRSRDGAQYIPGLSEGIQFATTTRKSEPGCLDNDAGF
jgi:hypothetical protein